MVCWRDGSIAKQLEYGEVGDEVAPRTKKGGVIFSLKKFMESVFKMGQSKTHDAILTVVMGLQGNSI